MTVLLEEVFENLNEQIPDFELLVEAANALYMAGRWSLENPQFGAPCEEHQIALWEDLRDALGHAPEHSTIADVNPHSCWPIPDGVIHIYPGFPIEDHSTFPQGIIGEGDLEPVEPEVKIQKPKEPTDIEKLCHRLDVMISHLEDIAENTEFL